jgi:hypothetical protein
MKTSLLIRLRPGLVQRVNAALAAGLGFVRGCHAPSHLLV